jgi:hypothetical protein
LTTATEKDWPKEFGIADHAAEAQRGEAHEKILGIKAILGQGIALGFDRGMGPATYPHMALPHQMCHWTERWGNNSNPSPAVLRHAESHRVPTIALVHVIYILWVVNLARRPVGIFLG